jgi:hypothetical protein
MHWVIVRPFSRLLVPDAGGLPQSGILWPPPNHPTLEFYFKIDTNVNTHNVFGGVEEFQRHEIKFSIPKKQAMLGNSTVGADLQANQWVALQLGVSVFQKLDAFDLEVESYVGGSMILRGLQIW